MKACRPDELERAVDWIRQGGIVAFPTDTFYGLAVDPTSSSAVEEVFDLKGRDARAALPLVAASTGQVEALCGPLDSRASRLARAFWPGPLSLVLNAPSSLAPAVHAGQSTAAIRVPAHDLARALCAAWGAPLTATSANRSGEPPARGAHDLRRLSDDARVLIVDGGDTPGGAASTIVDTRGEHVVLVRDGAIAWERVLESVHE